MLYIEARLFEDGFLLTEKKKHCNGCGMWLYCFEKDGTNRWFNTIYRGGERIFQEHDIWICDGRRGRRKLDRAST